MSTLPKPPIPGLPPARTPSSVAHTIHVSTPILPVPTTGPPSTFPTSASPQAKQHPLLELRDKDGQERELGLTLPPILPPLQAQAQAQVSVQSPVLSSQSKLPVPATNQEPTQSQGQTLVQVQAGPPRRFTPMNNPVPTEANSTISEVASAPVSATTSPVVGSDAKSRERKEGEEPAPKKRRKVNHACVYCRRSHMTCDLERPCTRCIKRNIGHLCHDEKREPDKKKNGTSTPADEKKPKERQSPTKQSSSIPPRGEAGNTELDPGAFGMGQNILGLMGAGLTGTGSAGQGLNPFANISELFMGHNHFSDLPNYHPSYMAAASEVNNEFNLLNDFLHTSMLDDGLGLTAPGASDDATFAAANGTSRSSDILNGYASLNGSTINRAGGPPTHLDALGLQTHSQNNGSMLPPPGPSAHGHRNINSHGLSARGNNMPTSVGSSSTSTIHPPPPHNMLPRDRDKAARDYYLQAADPIGNDTPEERMQRLLKAKYDAGLLKPFNYIRGYQKLSAYLDSHIAPASKQKIVKCLDRFRPKFREIAQALTDVELVVVEMWFEKQLLEYDRVFASMAVPACLWRRTGEIFRGNKEMAQILRVPVEKLRDGSIALHQIMTEDSMVRYWEEFETIAFDPDHDTLLTACSLKSPGDKDPGNTVNCAFSFMIHRDDYKMPTLIIGNFLPHDPMN